MATKLFHWEFYEMHFSGWNVCTSNKISVQLVNSLSLGRYGSDFKMQSAKTFYADQVHEYVGRNCCQLNASKHLWREVNAGSGNGLVTSGNKPLSEPMLTQVDVAMWHQYSLAYSFGYICRGRLRMQIKIVAVSLLFVKLHLLNAADHNITSKYFYQ